MQMAWSNGYPLVYSDSGTYVRSGFEGWIPKDRPIFYGYFIRHMSLSTSLWYVAFAQSLLLSYLIFLLFKKHVPHTAFGSYFIIAIALLTLTTGISFNCSMLIPDLFTALLCLAFILLLKPGELNPFERCITSLLFIYSILTHNSHLILLFFLFLILLILLAIQRIFRQSSGLALKNLYWSGLLYIFSVLLFPGLNYLIGKKFMISEASHIFLMHKLHDNDLLVRYLNENCELKNYSICAYKDSLPWDIIWDERSPITRNGDWDQYKEENLQIIKDVLSTYRYAKVLFVKSIHQTFKQFFTFNTGDAPMIDALIKPPLGAIDWHFMEELREFFSSRQYTKKLNFDAINRMQTIVVYLSLVILFLSYGKRPSVPLSRHRTATTVMLTFLICNAFTCASFSNVLDRYQGRVIWLIPLFAFFVCLDYWHNLPPKPKSGTQMQVDS